MRHRTFVPLAAMLALAGCGWFGDSDKPKLEGERIPIIVRDATIEADERIAEVPVTLPAAAENQSWPQPGGTPSHMMGHLAGTGRFAVAWRSSIGSGSSRDGRITAMPVVADGLAFAMDAGSQVTAVDAASGGRAWSFDVSPEGESSGGMGGGVAFDRGRLYVTTGYAQAIALNARDGKELWRTTLSAPSRSGPTVVGDRVYVITIDNQMHALETETGKKVWTHTGIAEVAGLFGGASAASDGRIIVAPYSSGEMFGLRPDIGRVIWSDSFASAQRADAVSAFADIRGLPVIDQNVVYAVSNSGRMAAVDMRSGGRYWDRAFGSLFMPWVAGDFIFLTTVDNEVLCITRREGRVRWITPLPRYEDEKRRSGRYVWTNPVLVEGQLFVAGTAGQGYVLSPLTGEVTGRISLPGPVSVSPVVAQRTVYLVTDGGDLVALR